MKFKLLPCAPCDLDGIERWINDEQKAGWRLKRFGALLPFVAAFVPDGEGGEYTITMDFPKLSGYERVCVLRSVGYIVKGKPKGAFGEGELRAAARKIGVLFAPLFVLSVATVMLPRMNTDLLAWHIACALASVAVGAFFLLPYDPAKTPPKLGLALYSLGVLVFWAWFIGLVVDLIAAVG